MSELLETETVTAPAPDAVEFEVVPSPASMVERINELHALVNHHARTSIETALELGKMLCECRKSISHGNWQKWIKTNLAFSYKTAFRYQELWKRRERIAELTQKGHVSLLEDGGLTAVYHELDIISRQTRPTRASVSGSRRSRTKPRSAGKSANRKRTPKHSDLRHISHSNSLGILKPNACERNARQ